MTTNPPKQCAWCGRWLRNGRWVEDEMLDMAQLRQDIVVDHGMCPECFEKRSKRKDKTNDQNKTG